MHKFFNEMYNYLPDFISECCEGPKRVPYIKKGILNIESFYWWALIAYFRPQIVVESGVAHGRSTEIIARAVHKYNVDRHFAFEVEDKYELEIRKKLAPYKTKFVLRPSDEGFKDTLSVFKFDNAVAIIDGPKAPNELSKVIGSLKGRNVAIGCHDCFPGSKVREVFAKFCYKLLNRAAVFTEPDSRLTFLNDYISTEVRQITESFQDSLQHSNYVGICL